MISGYPKTDLNEQERIIAEWKAENGFVDAPVKNSTDVQKWKRNNSYLFDKSPAHLEKQTKIREKEAIRRSISEPIKQKSRKPSPKPQQHLMINPAKHKRFNGVYGELQGTTMPKKLIWLLEQHNIIDIDALVKEHNLNRVTFLQTAKKLEKAKKLSIIKSDDQGKPAKFLERVA